MKPALGISIRFLAISIFAIIEIDLLVSSVSNHIIMRSRDLLKTIKNSCFVEESFITFRISPSTLPRNFSAADRGTYLIIMGRLSMRPSIIEMADIPLDHDPFKIG